MCDFKGLFTLKTLWILANITCTGILTVQVIHVLEGYINPTITRTFKEEVPLHDMDFPLVIKVCVIPGFNQTALQEMGYKDTWGYFLGQSRFNKSLFGWAGHTKQSGTIKSVEEVLEHVSDFKLENMVTNVDVYTRDGGHISIALEKLKLKSVNFPNNCFSMSLFTIAELKGKKIQQLFLSFSDLRNYTIQILLVGNTIDTGRLIREYSTASAGDVIELKANERKRAYMVDINQRVFVEEATSSNCCDYPNQEYKSYEECDDRFMRKMLPSELIPIWVTDHADTITTHALYENDTTIGKS